MPTWKPSARDVKIEAVTVVTDQGQPRKQVARDRGRDLTTLRRWSAECEADRARLHHSGACLQCQTCPSPVRMSGCDRTQLPAWSGCGARSG